MKKYFCIQWYSKESLSHQQLLKLKSDRVHLFKKL